MTMTRRNWIAYLSSLLEPPTTGSSNLGSAVFPGGPPSETAVAEGRNPDWVSVISHGADRTGVEDSTASIERALQGSRTRLKVGSDLLGGGRITSWSTPVVLFESGIYRISRSIQIPNFTTIEGHQAIVIAPDNIDVFVGIGPQVRISGIAFHRGRCAVCISTRNMDTAQIDISRCEFIEQQDTAIRTDSQSQSTLLTIEYSKFYQRSNPASRVLDSSADYTYFRDNWVSAIGHRGVLVSNGTGPGLLLIEGMVGVPYDRDGYWIENHRSVHVFNSRFGGERGGMPVLKNYTASGLGNTSIPTSVIFENNEIYCAFHAAPLQFFSLPGRLRVRGNRGFLDSDGMYFDKSIDGEQRRRFCETGAMEFEAWGPANQRLRMFSADSDPLVRETALSVATPPVGVASAFQPLSRLVLTILIDSSGYGLNQSVTSATYSASLDELGNPVHAVTSTSTSASYQRLYFKALAGLTEGLFTFVSQFELSGPASVTCRAGASSRQSEFNTGRYVLSCPFVIAADVPAQCLGLSFHHISAGRSVRIWSYRVYAGTVQADDLLLRAHADAIPQQGGPFLVGDRLSLTPKASGPILAICIKPGSPGTWRESGF